MFEFLGPSLYTVGLLELITNPTANRIGWDTGNSVRRRREVAGISNRSTPPLLDPKHLSRCYRQCLFTSVYFWRLANNSLTHCCHQLAWVLRSVVTCLTSVVIRKPADDGLRASPPSPFKICWVSLNDSQHRGRLTSSGVWCLVCSIFY